MGFLDKLLGRTSGEPTSVTRSGAVTAYPPVQPEAPKAGPQDSTTGATPEDQAAIARYRYLLRTAPPEQVEQVHAEAFARLTPAQRQAVLGELTRTLPAHEAPRSEDPQALARAATRAEMSRPGYMQNTFGRSGMGMGMGGVFAGSMLGTIAGVVVGSALADALLGGFEQSPEATEAGGTDAGASEGTDTSGSESTDASGDAGTDASADAGGWGDFGGGDFGGF